MNGTEYRSLNQLRKYPFNDTSSLVSTNGNTIPNDLISEAVFYHTSTAFFTVDLVLILVTANDSLYMEFAFKDLSGGLLSTQGLTVPLAFAIPDRTMYGATPGYQIKVTLGRGITQFLTSAKNWVFTSGNAKVLDNCCINTPASVTSIVLENNDSSFKTIASGESLDLDAGSNILFDATGVSVIPGQGTGLHNPCNEELFIKSINFIQPDSSNNFGFTTDSCYQVTPQENGILLENECKPKCTDVQLKAVGTYMLRLQDGIRDLGVFAKDLADDLIEKIEDYNAGPALTKNDPYSRHAVSKFPATPAGWYNFSVVVGFFNPSPDAAALNLTITGGTPVTGTIRLVTTEGTEVLSNLTLVDKSVPCVSQGRLEFVVKSTTLNLSLTGTLGPITINQTITST